MRIREFAGKVIGFALVAGALIGGGILVLVGPHAYNDYFNTFLGAALVLIGLGVGGVGTLIILMVTIGRRREAREHALRITPRPGPLGPPPAWGMGDIGRPGSGVLKVGEVAPPRGGGAPRLMSVSVGNLDAPLLIGFLLAWTAVVLIWLSPH